MKDDPDFIHIRHWDPEYQIRDTWIKPKKRLVDYSSDGENSQDGPALQGEDRQGNEVLIPIRSIVRVEPEHIKSLDYRGTDLMRRLPQIIDEGLAASNWSGVAAHPSEPIWLEDNKMAFNILDEKDESQYEFYIVTVEGKHESGQD